jgi:RNA polymerase sigma factor (sigma-70 family)
MATGQDDPTLEHSGSDSTVILLRRAKGGDDGARNQLFDRLRPMVRRWATGRLPVWARFRSDSDDLVQEALMATVRNLPKIDATDSVAFYAYLHRALQNKILDEVSRAKLRPRWNGEPLETVEEFAPSPLDALLGAEAFDRYKRALARLSQEDQAAIVVRIELGFTLEETAVELGKPSADAARMAVSRAVKRVVEAMQHER